MTPTPSDMPDDLIVLPDRRVIADDVLRLFEDRRDFTPHKLNRATVTLEELAGIEDLFAFAVRRFFESFDRTLTHVRSGILPQVFDSVRRPSGSAERFEYMSRQKLMTSLLDYHLQAFAGKGGAFEIYIEAEPHPGIRATVVRILTAEGYAPEDQNATRLRIKLL